MLQSKKSKEVLQINSECTSLRYVMYTRHDLTQCWLHIFRIHTGAFLVIFTEQPLVKAEMSLALPVWSNHSYELHLPSAPKEYICCETCWRWVIYYGCFFHQKCKASFLSQGKHPYGAYEKGMYETQAGNKAKGQRWGLSSKNFSPCGKQKTGDILPIVACSNGFIHRTAAATNNTSTGSITHAFICMHLMHWPAKVTIVLAFPVPTRWEHD